jgi:hypothetical protein
MSTRRKVTIWVGVGVVVLVIIGIAIPVVLGTANAISTGKLTNIVPAPTSSTQSWNGPGFKAAFPTEPTRSTESSNGIPEVLWNDGGINPTHGEYLVSAISLQNGESAPNSSNSALGGANGGLQEYAGNPSVKVVESPTPTQVGGQYAAIYAVSGPVSVLDHNASGITSLLAGIGNKPVIFVFEVIPEGTTIYLVAAQGVGTQIGQIPGGNVFLKSFRLSS